MPGKYLHVAIHLIWSTAHREACIEHEWQDPLYGYLGGVLKNKSSKLICAGGTADHLHHRKQDFKTEFLEFIQKHGVEYDERYMWD